MDAEDFVGALYDGMSGGVVELRSISHEEDQPTWRDFVDNPLSMRMVMDRYAARPGRTGIFYGVALRKPGSKRGRKQDIKIIPALWADVDVAKLEWDMQRTVGAIKAASPRPSVVVNSGNGLHLYWLLSEPIVLPDEYEDAIETVLDVEQVMKDLAGAFGGDNTADITRILRLPGTQNMKGDKPRPVDVVFGDWNSYSLDALRMDPKTHPRLDNGSWLSASEVKAKTRRTNKGKKLYELISTTSTDVKQTQLGIDAVFRATKLGGGQGFYGLDDAMAIGLAKLYSQYYGEWTDEQIIAEVLRRVAEIRRRDAPDQKVDLTREYAKAKEKLERWKVKIDVLERTKHAGRRKR